MKARAKKSKVKSIGTSEQEATSLASPSSTAPTVATFRRYEESAVIGDYDVGASFRLEDASTATMLSRLLAPNSLDDLLPRAIELAADELYVFESFIEASPDTNREIVTHVLQGIEERLRVLAEIARRARYAPESNVEVKDGAS